MLKITNFTKRQNKSHKKFTHAKLNTVIQSNLENFDKNYPKKNNEKQ